MCDTTKALRYVAELPAGTLITAKTFQKEVQVYPYYLLKLFKDRGLLERLSAGRYIRKDIDIYEQWIKTTPVRTRRKPTKPPAKVWNTSNKLGGIW